MKHGYESHLYQDDDPAHNTVVEITGRTRPSVSRRPRNGNDSERFNVGKSSCISFLRPLQVMRNVRLAVRLEDDGLVELMDEAKKKIKLFMAQRLRCTVQNYRIDRFYTEMIEAEPERYSAITLDYKMKNEPRKYRKKSSVFYGRIGISWHGAVVSFATFPEPVGHDGRDRSGGVKHIFYDHVYRNS